MATARQSHRVEHSLKEREFLVHEAEGLLTRLLRVTPFELTMPSVRGAAISREASKGIFVLMKAGKRALYKRIQAFIRGMQTDAPVPPEDCQAAYSILKLQFNALLDQFDIFADVVSQRSEHQTGVWISGLDALARDSLLLNGDFYKPPPLICYLDRGHGAAIRRARTRLPGGRENPVAVIKIPRERMVASGIGSSLVHEVGHQGSALLELIPSVRRDIEERIADNPDQKQIWALYSRWISEILSDLWSVATIGVGASTGLINVVSLPRYFVFRMPDADPHPFPYIRVKISLAFGKALFPDPQWDRLRRLWETFYPLTHLKPAKRSLIVQLENTLPEFVDLVLNHRPESLKGFPLKEVFPVRERQPRRLRALFQQWQRNNKEMFRARPGLVFAAVGQARADRIISPFYENGVLADVLRHWALVNI